MTHSTGVPLGSPSKMFSDEVDRPNALGVEASMLPAGLTPEKRRARGGNEPPSSLADER